jgi:hypothetical protein
VDAHGREVDKKGREEKTQLAWAGSEQLSHLFEMDSRKLQETWNSATALPDHTLTLTLTLTSISAGAKYLVSALGAPNLEGTYPHGTGGIEDKGSRSEVAKGKTSGPQIRWLGEWPGSSTLPFHASPRRST